MPDGGALTPLDEYRFDVGGWFVLPGLLSPADLALALQEAASADGTGGAADSTTELLCGHPTLHATLAELMPLGDYNDESSGGVPQMLAPPAPLDDAGGDGFLRQWADGVVRDHAKHYEVKHGKRVCMGVRVVWCLDDGSDFVLVPGSHLASIPTPTGVLGQGAAAIKGPAGDAGGIVCPPLTPGDVLIHAASMVWGRSGAAAGGPAGCLLAAEFTAINDSQNVHAYGADVATPEWVHDLSPTERAALGWHDSGPNGGDSGAALLSDGTNTWVSPAVPVPPAPDGSLPLYGSADQPATLRDPLRHLGQQSSDSLTGLADGQGEYELDRWRWDVSGMLIVRGAMDPDWLADAYAAIDYISAPDAPREPAAAHTDPDQWQTHSSFFAGQPGPAVSTGRQMWDPARWPDGAPPGGLLGLPRPHCDPFRRMLTCPALVHRLNWMMGAGWALAHGSLGIRTTRRGEAGLHLHAGGAPARPSNLLTWFDGRTHCEYINVAYQLRDVNCDGQRDGGFNAIPGSHKASKPMPGRLNAVTSTGGSRPGGLHISPDPLWESGHLVVPSMRAGDLLLFMGSGQTHGADAWRAEEDRSVVLMNIWGPNMMRGRRPKL